MMFASTSFKLYLPMVLAYYRIRHNAVYSSFEGELAIDMGRAQMAQLAD